MNRNTRKALSSAILLTTSFFLCASAAANIKIAFVESAPKDRFSITNSGECTVQEMVVTFDLEQTAGRLIFDTTSTGAGVEVFQPFEVREGEIKLVTGSKVDDGAKSLSVLVKVLQPGSVASFTIDVDDTLDNSDLGMIRVTDAEISGGSVNLQIGEAHSVSGKFGAKGEILLSSPDC